MGASPVDFQNAAHRRFFAQAILSGRCRFRREGVMKTETTSKPHRYASAGRMVRVLAVAGFTFACILRAEESDASRTFFPGSITPVRPMASANNPMLQGELSLSPFNRSAQVVRNVLTPLEIAAPLTFEIALPYRNPKALDERLGKGEIISQSEMVERYYPLKSSYDKIVRWLHSRGFETEPEDRTHLLIFAHGSIARIQQGFQSQFARVAFQGGEFTSAITAPSVPNDIAPLILGINGLQPHLRPHKNIILPGPRITTAMASPPPYAPSQILSAYNGSSLPFDGTGQQIGIVIDTVPAISDLQAFWSACKFSGSPPAIVPINVTGVALPAPSGEETLDAEWSSAIAPGATIRIYATSDLDFVDLDKAYKRILDDLGTLPTLTQVSLSYGLGETYESSTQATTDDGLFKAMASAGITVFASAGDGGSSPGPSGHDHSGPTQAELPASDPNVTGVGGTTLTLGGTSAGPGNEIAWADGGGGFSIFFDRPTWQSGPTVPGATKRTVPDVAADADPNPGAYFYFNGQPTYTGGTSWSSPMWAGICARINQARQKAGKTGGMGLLGPRIYPLAGPPFFVDIVGGSNGANNIYSATAGYDLCTGLGVPNIQALIGELSK
jgi:kumamolisin